MGNGVMLVSDITAGSPAAGDLASAAPAVHETAPQPHEPPLLRALRLPRLRHQPARDRAAHVLFQQPARCMPTCTGLGSMLEFDPDVVDTSKSLAGGAIRPWNRDTATIYHLHGGGGRAASPCPARRAGQGAEQESNGCRPVRRQEGRHHPVRYVNNEGHDRVFQTHFEGVVTNLQRRYRETTSDISAPRWSGT